MSYVYIISDCNVKFRLYFFSSYILCSTIYLWGLNLWCGCISMYKIQTRTKNIFKFFLLSLDIPNYTHFMRLQFEVKLMANLFRNRISFWIYTFSICIIFYKKNLRYYRYRLFA